MRSGARGTGGSPGRRGWARGEGTASGLGPKGARGLGFGRWHRILAEREFRLTFQSGRSSAGISAAGARIPGRGPSPPTVRRARRGVGAVHGGGAPRLGGGCGPIPARLRRARVLSHVFAARAVVSRPRSLHLAIEGSASSTCRSSSPRDRACRGGERLRRDNATPEISASRSSTRAKQAPPRRLVCRSRKQFRAGRARQRNWMRPAGSRTRTASSSGPAAR